jgi:hypothetical protein
MRAILRVAWVRKFSRSGFESIIPAILAMLRGGVLSAVLLYSS